MQRIAGLLFFLGASVVILGIMTAEIFYPPGYSVSLNMISNLAATPPPDSVIYQPAASIFDSSMIVSGLFISCGAYFLYRAAYSKHLVISVVVMGLGASAVGVFPAYHAVIHPIVAFATFFAGGLAALFSVKTTGSPFAYIAACCGVIAIALLLFGVLLPDVIIPYLGKGGTERWIAYPILLWLTGYGGYLMYVRKA